MVLIIELVVAEAQAVAGELCPFDDDIEESVSERLLVVEGAEELSSTLRFFYLGPV